MDNTISKENQLNEHNDTNIQFIRTFGHIFDENILSLIKNKYIYPESLMYMNYRYHRLEKNPVTQKKQLDLILEYIRYGNSKISKIQNNVNEAKKQIDTNIWNWELFGTDKLLQSSELKLYSDNFVNSKSAVKKSVDLFLTTWQKTINQWWDMSFVILDRKEYPIWKSLPWWIITKEDENNDYNIPGNIYTALRIAWTKVIWENKDDLIFGYDDSDANSWFYYVKNKSLDKWALIYTKDIVWFGYDDRLWNIIEPSDPRYLVSTTWYKMELFWKIEWLNMMHYKDVQKIWQWDLAFTHHRKILRWLVWKTEEVLTNNQDHHNFIKNIIKNPEDIYKDLHKRFEDNNFWKNTPVPEFLPIIKYYWCQIIPIL